MLRLALLFVVLALIAGLLGFQFVMDESLWFAKVLFFVFIVLAVLSFVGGALRGRRPPA
jgi:uncharacterized membrane protein YtjA (UPF0391 family)